MQHFGDGRDWFFEKRFGLFIHWGLYAINGWHEQDQWRRSIPRKIYEQLQQEFIPVHFNPDEWLDAAEAAGMEYLCVTTKHHDGFCLWDTAQTDYNIMHTPYGRDVLRMLAEACQRRRFPLCLYYSVVDWHHPNYPNQGRSHELLTPEPGDEPNIERYLEFLRAQVRELCTQYGEIHGFWWDMNVTGLVDPSINNMIRELQPKAVINNRGFDDGDFGTPERDLEQTTALVFERPTEACQSIGRESWGYREDEDYYSLTHLLRSIDRTLARGGNYLLNVGPKADGTLPGMAVNRLARIGDWYESVREAFDGAEPVSALTENREVMLTRKDRALYVHLTQEPTVGRVLLKPMTVKPRSAVLLNTGETLAFSTDSIPTQHMDGGGLLTSGNREWLRVYGIPVDDLTDTVPVIKLEFDEPFR